MAAGKESGTGREQERKPVVLSKDEALYPPSGKAVKIAVIVGIVAITLAVASFILFPIA